jgi:tetratricopeptide (TPR) repeat protein
VFYRGLPSFSSFTILLVSGVLVLGTLSCSRGHKPAVERIAVVRFENLSSNTKLNWASRAIASALVYDLAPSRELHAQTVDSTSGAYTNDASEMLEGYFSESSGQLEMTATLENLGKTKTVATFELGGPASAGVLPLVNQLAKRLNAAARPFGTSKEETFRAYGEVLGGTNPEAMANELKTATDADPHFALGYLIWARLLAAEGQREQSVKILQAARAANPDAIDAAEIDYVAASIASDVDGRAKALETLTRLTPADVNWLRELAGLRLAQRRFQEAARNYEAATRLDGEDAELWNQLGYAYAFEQDLASANRALEHYEQMLGPENSNALDSLGEVNFFLGDFSEAEKYFLEAQEKTGARRGEELVKAAESRLMMGDLAGADGIFEKYLALAKLRQKQGAGFERAQWEFMTGRRKAGMARLEQMIPALTEDEQSLAYSQLSIWKLETGSGKDGVELAQKAEGLARGLRARTFSAISKAMAGGPGIGSGPANVYALLFARKYAEAVGPLEALYRETNPSVDGQIRTLLAWADVETGRIEEARKLVQIYPLPLSAGDPVLASLIFPRFLYLRGVVLDGEGKKSKAKQSYDLFLRYSGDAPDVFGHEAAAKRALGRG